MSDRLTLRRESLQRSSSSSQALAAYQGGATGQANQAAHEQRPISLTTLFTLTKD